MLSLSSPQSSSFRRRPVSCWCWIIFFCKCCCFFLMFYGLNWQQGTFTSLQTLTGFLSPPSFFWSSISCLRSRTATPPCAHTLKNTLLLLLIPTGWPTCECLCMNVYTWRRRAVRQSPPLSVGLNMDRWPLFFFCLKPVILYVLAH